MNFSKEIIVITGSTGGIGRAIASKLSQLGAKLVLTGRNETKLAQLKAQLGEQHSYVCADLLTLSGRNTLISQAKTLQATMLINNAGMGMFSTLDDMDDARLQQIIEMNLFAPLSLIRAFLSQVMPDKSRTIVNVGSVFGNIGFPMHSGYCATKFGLRGYTEAIRRELSNTNDHILYFAPRATDTEMNSFAASDMNAQLGNKIDTPEFVANQLAKQLQSKSSRVVVGWPEKIFARLNGLVPELVDNAIAKKIKKLNLTQHVSAQ